MMIGDWKRGFMSTWVGFQILLEAEKEGINAKKDATLRSIVVEDSEVAENALKDETTETLKECSQIPASVLERGGDDITVEVDSITFTIRLEDLILLVKEGILQPPSITIRDIKERSKTDQFARVVTSFQVIYFAIHSFGRLISGLSISTSEISAIAFICCAAFIEFFWWKKPLDIRTPTIHSLSQGKRAEFMALLPRLCFNAPEQDLAEKIDLKLFFNRIMNGEDMKKNVVHAVWIGCIFNGIHISAWNYSFPTDIERLLWRLASTGACGLVVIVWVASFLRPKILGLAISVLSCTAYCVCRLYLAVEIFVDLRSAPASIYQSAEWQNTLPGV